MKTGLRGGEGVSMMRGGAIMMIARWIAVVVLGVAGVSFAQTAEKKLLAAEGLAARGEYEMGRGEFSEFLRGSPENTRGRYGLALCLYNLNDLAGAERELAVVIGDKGFGRRDEAMAVLGCIYLTNGRPGEALAIIDEFRKSYPKSAQAEGVSVNRAQALYRLGRFEESLAEAREMLGAYPKSALRASALYVAALDQRALGDEAGAGGTLRELTGAYPNAPFASEAQIQIGELLTGQGKHEEAVNHFKALETGAPEGLKPAVRYGLGMALAGAAKFGEAEQTFVGLAGAYPQSPYAAMAKVQVGVVQIKAGKVQEARGTLASVGVENPAMKWSVAYWLARCDLVEGKYEAARGALEKLAATKFAEAEEVEFDLAYCALRLNQDAEAVKRLEAFRGNWPRSRHGKEALYFEALAEYRLGEAAKSVALCEAAGGARPAVMLKGESLLMLGRFGEADGVFAGLERESGDAGDRVRLGLRRGQCKYFAKDYAAAEAVLQGVGGDAKDPLAQEARVLLGDAQLQQGKNELAMRTLQGCVEAGTVKGEEARFKLGMAQLRAGDESGAQGTWGALQKGEMKSEWVQRAWYEQGQLLYQRGKVVEASQAMGTLMASRPVEELAGPGAYLMARIEMELKEYGEAMGWLDRLCKEHGNSPLVEDATMAKGVCLKDSGQYEAALQQFRGYPQAYPKGKFVAEARHQEAVCLSALGKAPEAIGILEGLAEKGETRNEGVVYDLAWAYRASGNVKNAIATYQAMLKEYSGGGRAGAGRVELAELLYLEKRYSEAVGVLEKVVGGEGSGEEQKKVESRKESRGGEGQKGGEGGKESLRAAGIYRLGHCYGGLKEWEKAARTFDGYPGGPLAGEAISEAGVTYAQMGKLEEAKQRQMRVMKEFKGTDAAAMAMIRLGEVQNQGGEYEAAGETFGRWVKEWPGHGLTARAWFGVGWSLENRGKLEEAREWYTKVVGVDNGAVGARAQFQMGETFFAQKQYELAAKELLKVDILYSSPEWAARGLYEAGRAFEQMGQVEKAKQQFRECVRKYGGEDVAGMARRKVGE